MIHYEWLALGELTTAVLGELFVKRALPAPWLDTPSLEGESFLSRGTRW